jgi:hypothetical protein
MRRAAWPDPEDWSRRCSESRSSIGDRWESSRVVPDSAGSASDSGRSASPIYNVIDGRGQLARSGIHWHVAAWQLRCSTATLRLAFICSTSPGETAISPGHADVGGRHAAGVATQMSVHDAFGIRYKLPPRGGPLPTPAPNQHEQPMPWPATDGRRVGHTSAGGA